MKRFHVILFTLFVYLCLHIVQMEARVIISEFLAVNDKGINDRDGDRSDWIEIRNTLQG